MKKQFATNLDERVIKGLKKAAIDHNTTVNEILEAIVCDVFNGDGTALCEKLNAYRNWRENLLDEIEKSKVLAQII